MLRLLRAMATRLMGRGSSASLTRLQTAVNNHLERGENHTRMMAFPASVSQRPKPINSVGQPPQVSPALDSVRNRGSWGGNGHLPRLFGDRLLQEMKVRKCP